MSLIYNTDASSDTGKVRNVNEDSYSHADYSSSNKGIIFLVSDGMGGYSGGNIASTFITTRLLEYIGTSDARSVEELLERSVLACNEELIEKACSFAENSQMGATLALLMLNGYSGYICNIGDSRVYLIRENSIHQLSDDHTVVGDMVKAGLISKSESETHPKKHILSKVLGREIFWEESFIKKLHINSGDRFILCSDGLYNHVNDSEILQITSSNNVESAVKILLDTANDRGGTDNITVQIIEISEINE